MKEHSYNHESWEEWLMELPWAQFIEAVAILHNWDDQLMGLVKKGYMQYHPYRSLVDVEANTNHDPQNMPDNPSQD